MNNDETILIVVVVKVESFRSWDSFNVKVANHWIMLLSSFSLIVPVINLEVNFG